MVAVARSSPPARSDEKKTRPPRTPPDARPRPRLAAPAPPPPAPALGACYRLSYDEAVAPDQRGQPRRPATKAHTTQTFAVGQLDLVTNGHLLAVDSEAVRKQVAKRCPAQLAAYVGATEDQLRLSLLRPVWFTPTIEQSDAGAGWYRCDVIAVTGDKTLAKIDHDISEALKQAGGARRVRPVRHRPARHRGVQPGALPRGPQLEGDLGPRPLQEVGQRPVPGREAVKGAGQTVCADAARAIASDALDYEWGYEWPTKDQWQAGQTYGRCWSPDPAVTLSPSRSGVL